jgi:hypothetical protein
MSSVHIKHIFHKKLVLMKTNNPRAFKKEIKRLTLLGRRRNNLRGFTKKDRPIIPAYRRSGKSPTEGRILCQFCWTSITLRAYESTHGETCKRQSGVDDKLTPKQQKILLAVKQPIFETEDEQMEQLLAKWPSVFREVFFDMHLDRLKLTQFCLKEEVARRLVLSHIKDKSGSVTKISRTRSMIRMLYGMLSFFREIRSNSELTIEEAMDYDNWHCHTFDQNVHDIVACCNKVCGRIKKGDEVVFKSENDVMNFSSMMRRVSSILENSMHYMTPEVRRKWHEQAELLRKFIDSDAWKMDTVRVAAKQKAMKHSFNKTLVPPEDLKIFLDVVESHASDASAHLHKAWKERDKVVCKSFAYLVCEALGIAVGTFSYRRLTEPFLMTLRDFETRPNLQEIASHRPLDVQASSAKYISELFVMYSKGKSGTVMSIVKNKWLSTIMLLCDKKFRKFVGVAENNDTIFFTTRKSKLNYPNPSRSQKKFADLCKGLVPNHKILRSINFRASFATNMTKMDLTYAVKHSMCAMLGHTMEVHAAAYEVPQALDGVQVMGFACFASATNTVQDYASKKVEQVLNIKLPAQDKEQEDIE